MKPAEDAPMTALRLGEIGLECGLPAGVLNILPGPGPETGAALASHPDINQLTFTGSVEVGIAVAKMAADNIVPVVMELGGKSPNIVFADADLDLATQGVSTAIFQNAGQTCSAGSRLLVERKAHDALVEKLIARAKGMKIGPGVSDPDMGPIISKKQLETVESYVKIGQEEGARVVVGGKRPTDRELLGGNYFQPTLLDDVTRGMRVAQEEIFGPVLAIIPFDDLEEAAAIANDSVYGLVAGVWTRDINKALSLATRIKSGQVYINTYGAGGGVELPFGGYKKSGYGREKSLESLASYTQIKNVCIRYA
jgi:acyl-CoA reductase-like NAD-dependent aldehyde dehydrogenase